MPVELKCDFCGDLILKPPSHVKRSKNHFCDRSCYANWREGRKKKQQTLECDYCGKDFDRFESYLDENQLNYFCSNECRGRWFVDNRLETECTYCGEAINRTQHKLDSVDHHFCNRECHIEWTRANATYDWKSTPNYGPMWRTRRREVLERDDWTCQGCGRNKEELGYTPRVHHIRPFSEFADDETEQAHDPLNLVSLCAVCHARWEGIRLRPALMRLQD